MILDPTNCSYNLVDFDLHIQNLHKLQINTVMSNMEKRFGRLQVSDF